MFCYISAMPEDKTRRKKLRALDNYGIYMSKRYS